MKKPILLKVPTVNVPVGATRDYACGTFEGNSNFSCSPYGNRGNIDGHLQKEEKQIDDGWGPAIVGAVVGGVFTVGIALT